MSSQPSSFVWSALFEPKLFGWLLDLAEKVRLDTRLNGKGNLLDHECKILSSLVVKHIMAKLQSFGFGFNISERFLPANAKVYYENRTDYLRTVDETKYRRLRSESGPEMFAISGIITDELRLHLNRALGLFEGQQNVEDVITREPTAAGYFITKIMSAWQGITPARKFFLIGGEEALLEYYGGKIPPKRLRFAIYHICIRGTLTSADADIYKNAPNAVPTDDQILPARKFVAAIKTTFERSLTPAPRIGLSPLVPGLQTKLSLSGRSPGSRVGGFKRASGAALQM